MNKWSYILIAISLHFPLQAVEDISFLERQYQNFWDKLKLIKKCYIQKSCTKSEKEKADQTITRGIAVATLLYALSVGYRGARLFYIQRQNQDIKKNLSQITPIDSVEIKGSEVIVMVPKVAETNLYKDTITNIVQTAVPTAKKLIIQEIPLWLKLLPPGGATSRLIIPLSAGGG